MQSLKEAKTIASGEAKASRRSEIVPIGSKAVRQKICLSPCESASLVGYFHGDVAALAHKKLLGVWLQACTRSIDNTGSRRTW